MSFAKNGYEGRGKGKRGRRKIQMSVKEKKLTGRSREKYKGRDRMEERERGRERENGREKENGREIERGKEGVRVSERERNGL
jgi:hypothetical protein